MSRRRGSLGNPLRMRTCRQFKIRSLLRHEDFDRWRRDNVVPHIESEQDLRTATSSGHHDSQEDVAREPAVRPLVRCDVTCSVVAIVPASLGCMNDTIRTRIRHWAADRRSLAGARRATLGLWRRRVPAPMRKGPMSAARCCASSSDRQTRGRPRPRYVPHHPDLDKLTHAGRCRLSAVHVHHWQAAVF
jgi:hypothetical protein